MPFQYISGITVNEKPYVSDTSIIELRHLSLPYDLNNVNIELTAVEFSDPQHNTLLYKVKYESNHWAARLLRALTGRKESSDTTWTHAKQPVASLTFKNMSPGTYTIAFLAVNSDGERAQKISTFTIEIAQPWWQSPWFMLLLVALAAGGVVAIYRYRIALIKKEAALKYAQLQKEEEEKREIQKIINELTLRVQRAQMDTHFISNALETASGFILKAEQLKASKLISKIGALMRNVFRSSGNSVIPLRKELEIVEQYIEVETTGWDSQPDYQPEIDEQINEGQLMIPGLLLQTIVENALRHGLKTKEGEKNLSLHITREASLPAVRFTITDNGVGRPKDKRHSADDSELHATGITYDRLKLYDLQYPGEFTSRMDITDLEDAQGTPLGTRVDILLGMPEWAKNTSSESV
ncbi:MAG: hypothetical protein EAZ89_00445 [Bacteroidetes bacterium]|nr:MAG: hypothetical protein EAZ89_00445 [Bacteroidota bacterium]